MYNDNNNNNFNQQNPFMMYGYQNPMVRYQGNAAAASAQFQPQPMAPMMPPPQVFIKCRPVVSLDEARAAQIDLDGSLNVFTDIGNKKIYTKQINSDGTASLFTYALVEDGEKTTPDYITREEFNEFVAQLKNAAISPVASTKPAAPQLKF